MGFSGENIMFLISSIYFSMIFTTVFCDKQHVRVCGKANHNGSNGELLPHGGIIPQGHDCIWHIYPESFNIPEVYMVIEDFRLDANDRFVINKHDSDQLFGPFNGTKDTFTILTGFLMLDIFLRTANSPPRDRYFKSYFTTNDCYYLIEDESGNMTSPLYHNVNIRKNITCTWQFRKFKQVTLPRTVIFKKFNLINSTLTVKGSKAQDGIYSGTKLPNNIVAYGETQFILRLNTLVPDETFSFQYGLNLNAPAENHLSNLPNEVAETSPPRNLAGHHTSCGNINLQGLNGWFAPKDETMAYDHTCIWSIQPGPSQPSTEIYIVAEKYDVANNDSFVVRQSSGGLVLFGPYIGKKGHFSLLADGRKVDVALKTSESELLVKRHFRAYYSTGGCSYSITNNVGMMYSPLYKTRDQGETACTWKFHQDDEATITSIFFDNFNIKSSQLQIQGSVNQDNIYKGSEGPFDILMKTGGELTLEIDRTIENETFVFSYKNVTSACSIYSKIIKKQNFPVSFPPPESNNINSFDCQWILEGSEKSVLAIYFDQMHLADAEDLLVIKDGKTRASPTLVQVTESSQDHTKGGYVVSNSNVVWISFNSRFPFKGSQFKINVNISEQGGHLHNEQNFTIVPPESGVDVIFFLEVEEEEQVFLTLLPGQNVPSGGVILVYNGFSVNASLLTTIQHDKSFYPVVSTGYKMMIVAKGFNKNSSVALRFKGIPKGCHQVTLDQHGTFSLSGNCKSTCSWTILPKLSGNQETLSLHLSSIALGPNDVIEVKQLDDKMTHVTTVTSKENHMPNIYLPTSYGAYISITRGTCVPADGNFTVFSASAEVLKGCSISLDINSDEMVYLASPNYPDTYPFNSHCFWIVSTKAKNLYLSFENFQLANGHCLRVHEMSDGHQLDTVTYNSSIVPSDKMLKNNVTLELDAGSCVNVNNTVQTSRGNGFLAKMFALDCGGALGKEMEGEFSTPDFPNEIKGSLLCIWYVEVPAHNDDGSVNVISFDIQWSSTSTDKETGLIVYDGSSLTSELLTNISITESIMSKTNSLIFIYKQEDKSKSHAAVKVNFQSRAGNTLCDNGIYMHPDWVCNDINDCGDYSDEKNCKGRAPLPPPVPPRPPNINIIKSGYSPSVFWPLIATMPLVGVLLTISVAFAVKTIKRRREQDYDTLPILT